MRWKECEEIKRKVNYISDEEVLKLPKKKKNDKSVRLEGIAGDLLKIAEKRLKFNA